MRIAELSRRTGVPTPTLKYYLREGLLPAGDRTGPNQAQYNDGHIRRIRLIKAMLDIGGLSIAAIREILVAIDGSSNDVHHVLGLGACGAPTKRDRATTTTAVTATATAAEPGSAAAEGLVAERGWVVSPDARALAALAEVIETLRALDQDDILDRLADYAAAAEAIARVDLALIRARTDIDSMVEGVIVGNVLGDTLIAALRRLAQESISAHMFGGRQASEASDVGTPGRAG